MADSGTSTLTYDAENRLTAVSGATSASFTYAGDGNRVKSVMGGVTTYYVGNHFEWTGNTTSMVKYYYAGGQRAAMRQGSSTVYYLLGDHLGSTSITASSSGSKVAELRYHPWGGTRYTSGTTPTSYQFTGQRNDATGLYFYNARYYDPYLNRFISPDTIIPDPGNPQSLNRYSYVLNSPLNYIDPSGHREVRYTEGEWITQEIFSEYAGEWDIAKQARNRAIIETIFSVADTVAAILWEPYDWVSTGVRCTQGGCNALDYAGFLPLIPGALGRVDDVARAANRIDDTTDTLRAIDNSLENSGEILVRRGQSWESATRLNRQALEAEAKGFPHGVSVTTPESNARLARDPLDVSQTTRQALTEAGFPVHHTPTRTDPWHHTVELPRPVTNPVAVLFNLVFGRSR